MMLQEKNGIEVSAEDAVKLHISKADFDYALLHDIKPAYGISKGEFHECFRSGWYSVHGAVFSIKMVEATPIFSFQAS